MNHTEPTYPTPEATDTSASISDEELMEAALRMQNLYAAVDEKKANEKSKGEQLQELFQAGETEKLNETIEDLAYELMEQGDPEYLELLASRKTNPNVSIKDRVLEIVENYKKFITSEAGLPDEARFTEIENARSSVAEIIGDTPTDPQQALESLNIIQRDEEGNATYRFPEELVPESVNEKWKIYLTTVCDHVKASREQAETGDEQKTMDADAIRKYAHDSVTRDVHAILGLEGVNGWDFGQTRSLLASIRDAVFPTLGTVRSSPREEEHANKLIGRYHDKEVRATSKLAGH